MSQQDQKFRREYEDGSSQVIGAMIRVHRALGPGLLESAYEACVCRELELSGIAFRRQVPVPVIYRGVDVDCAYYMDIVADGRIVIELKSVERLEMIHSLRHGLRRFSQKTPF